LLLLSYSNLVFVAQYQKQTKKIKTNPHIVWVLPADFEDVTGYELSNTHRRRDKFYVFHREERNLLP
jgi:hypothetical protein